MGRFVGLKSINLYIPICFSLSLLNASLFIASVAVFTSTLFLTLLALLVHSSSFSFVFSRLSHPILTFLPPALAALPTTNDGPATSLIASARTTFNSAIAGSILARLLLHVHYRTADIDKK